MIRLLSTVSLVALALAGAPARAQDAAPENQQEATLPQTIPGLENFSLPSSNDRLRAPQTSPTPRVRPTPTPTPERSTPVIRPATPPPVMIQPLPTPIPAPSAAPTGRSEPRSRPTAAPTPAATPTPPRSTSATPETIPETVPPPVAVPAPTPTPSATATPVAAPSDREGGGSLLPIVLGLLAIAFGGLAWLFLARRRAEPEAEDIAVAPVPAVPPRRIAPAERPQLELGFRPRRAGMNVLSAAVDYELVVRNAGTAPARGVRVALQLVTAGERHDAELRRFLDAPVEAPIVAEFDLAPGDTKTMRAMAMLPKEAVNIVTVKGRPMFVPMVAINAVYAWGDGRSGQTATSHVVGIAQPGTPKMQPFWLDAPARMYDSVGEHAHAIAVNR